MLERGNETCVVLRTYFWQLYLVSAVVARNGARWGEGSGETGGDDREAVG